MKWKNLIAVFTALCIFMMCICVNVADCAAQSLSKTEYGNVNFSTEKFNLNTVIGNAVDYIVNFESNPGINSQWNIIGLARLGYVDQDFYDIFTENCVEYLVKKDGILSTTKYTEYSKLALSMTANGIDATDVSEYNLFLYLSDFENVTKQGINGAIWALIALNANESYEIPQNSNVDTLTTEEKLIEYIVGKQNKDGSYGLSQNMSDVDLTAMAITALSPYYNIDKEVTNTIDASINYLSQVQLEESAGFEGTNIENVESSAQVLLALCSLGIDAAADDRFIKNDINLIDVICSYQLSSGGFSHTEGGKVNSLATSQAFYSLVAYYRMLNGKSALFDMNDVELDTKYVTDTDKETIANEIAATDNTIKQDSTSKNDVKNSNKSGANKNSTNKNSTKEKSAKEKSVSENSTSENATYESSDDNAGWDFNAESYVPDDTTDCNDADNTSDSSVKTNVMKKIAIIIILAGIVIGAVFTYKKKKSLMMIFLFMLLLTGCSKKEINVDDMNQLPDDGIVSADIIEAIAEDDRTVSFYSTDEDTKIEYTWTLDGNKIKNPEKQNLKLTFITENLNKISKMANDADYVIALETYDDKMVCAPELTLKIPQMLNIDKAYLCKRTDTDTLAIMSDVEINAGENITELSMKITEFGDTYYIVGGLSSENLSADEYQAGENANSDYDENQYENDTEASTTKNDTTSYEKQKSTEAKNDTESTSEKITENISKTCTISINCSTILKNMDKLNSSKKDFVPDDGWILKPVTVTIEEGDSVHDILKRVCKSNGIHMESSYSIGYESAYIEGINQIYELDCGELSGWMYSVNGWFPNYGCSQYEVEDGDVISIVYTCDLGSDIK